MMLKLRSLVPFEEFDYQVLLEALKDYKKPRDKISLLLNKGDIIRVKKGLYVFAEHWRKQAFSLEILANLIYGPSYISKEYALAYYGMIPERVYTLTSMTTGKTKNFLTPIGSFTYQHLNKDIYSIGVMLLPIDSVRSCLFATKEKALIDTILLVPEINSKSEMLEHLIDNLRIDFDALHDLDTKLIEEFSIKFPKKNIQLLKQVLQDL